MFYCILIVLLAVMWVRAFRASELYKITRGHKDDPNLPDDQVQVWYNLGGFNVLLLNNDPNMFISFLGGVGVLVAYGGLWMCAVGKWAGLAVVLVGVAVCVVTQLGMVNQIKAFFREYQAEMKEDPKEVFTGKSSLGHAVRTSINIGIARALSVVMFCSVVGILLYFFSKMMGRKINYDEEKIERGEGEEDLIDDNGDRWHCRYQMGDDVRVYRNTRTGKEIYVKTADMLEAQNKSKFIQIGNRTFHVE